jgi:hypothetical protein
MDFRDLPWKLKLTVPDGNVHLIPPKRAAADGSRLHVDADGPHEAGVSSPGGAEQYRRIVNVRFTVEAKPSAPLTLDIEGHVLTTTLEKLAREKLVGEADCGTWVLAPSAGAGGEEDPVDLEHGLGVKELHDEWVDPDPPKKHAWYYARVIDAAGEVTWSSPIFVAPP